MRASGCWVHRSGLTEILGHLEIAESTWCRWRQTYAGMTAKWMAAVGFVHGQSDLRGYDRQRRQEAQETRSGEHPGQAIAGVRLSWIRPCSRIWLRRNGDPECVAGWRSGSSGSGSLWNIPDRTRRETHAVTRREGLAINSKRTRRVWREEGLQRPRRRRAERRRLSDGTATELRARRVNHVWAPGLSGFRHNTNPHPHNNQTHKRIPLSSAIPHS